MQVSIGNVAINVSDLERSEHFYAEVLGLDVLARIDAPEVAEVIVGRKGEGSQLMLARHSEPAAPGPGGGFWKVFVQTDDAPGLFRRAVDSGAEPVMEPVHRPQWNVTIAMVRDPDGHLVELGQIHTA